MITPSKSILATAAIAGLLTGSFVNAKAATVSANKTVGTSLQTLADKDDAHSCKGKNSCKGQGGCKAGENGCKGKNSCKGKGGCATDGSKPSK